MVASRVVEASSTTGALVGLVVEASLAVIVRIGVGVGTEELPNCDEGAISSGLADEARERV